MNNLRYIKLSVIGVFFGILGLFLFSSGTKAGKDTFLPDVQKLRGKPPTPTSPFSPSNAQTADGQIIPIEQFFSSQRCASCHQETHAAWSESLHRNANRNPFYQASVKLLEKQRGIEFTTHCESCHTPTALFSGALVEGSKVSREMDDEGVTCIVCHSITEARLDGTGSFTIQRPALIVKEDGTPVYGNLPDEAILQDIEGHKRAVMRPLTRKPEFCATCHKVSTTVELNNYKFIRGFSVFDEWQASGASTESITPFYRREKRMDCRACHMPKTETTQDMAAKDGKIASHRFLGANTATPLFFGQTKQVELTTKFLENGVLSADIFALQSETTGKIYTALDNEQANAIDLQPGETLTAEVVVFNRRAAHSFPPEVRDLYEPWVEFEAVDAAGKTIYHSGYVKPDRTLDESAHTYKSILLDIESRSITRHQIWLTAIKAYDNFIPEGRGDLVRYRFKLPQKDFKNVTLRARVNYRRFVQEYTNTVLKQFQAMHLVLPIVKMAETTVKITGIKQSPKTKNKTDSSLEQVNKVSKVPDDKSVKDEATIWRRWNDYGIVLLEQSQYGAASEAFRKAAELDPKNPDPYISAAIAEMRMERYSPEQEQVKKAANLIAKALEIKPDLPRALFYRAVVWRAQGRVAEAATEFNKLAEAYPRDREVQRQLGQTLFSVGQFGNAKLAFEAIVDIDPTDSGAYQFLASIYASEGRKEDSIRAHQKYLLWRDDPMSDGIASRFFTLNPQWADMRIPYHIYSFHTPVRPVAKGANAAPAN